MVFHGDIGALGPDPAIAEVMPARLLEVGWEPGDAVVMAAAGPSDQDARRDVHSAGRPLADLVAEVHLGLVATGADPRLGALLVDRFAQLGSMPCH